MDVGQVGVQPGATAYAVVQLVDGDRRFLDSDKGVSLFDLDEAQVRLAQGYDIVHTAYTARWDDQVPRLIGAGCRVAYDFGRDFSPAMIAGLPGLWLAAFSGSHLDQAGLDQTASAALAAGSRYVLITQGPRGAWLWSQADRWYTPAPDVPVVDTLGAGDAFLASLIVSLAGDAEPGLAMTKASALAAEVIAASGAFGHGSLSSQAPVAEGAN